jgi:hypothetical protein
MLYTIGKCEIRVNFGPFMYKGPFYVLDCKVPLILGMEFFAKVSPAIDWSSRNVLVNVQGVHVRL